jgi:flavin-dependent dehydrogenase
MGFSLAGNIPKRMQVKQQYDVAIIGGGLAGLACAIQVSRAGHSVVLFEKEKYPFHKVCGEYVSMESWNFLQQLGVPLCDMRLPLINTLFLSAPNGKSFTTKLPLGGFGISRYVLDNQLAEIAKQNGVVILEATKVEEVHFQDVFQIQFSSHLAKQREITAKVCCGAYGKRSNLDIKWKRAFLTQQDKKYNNQVGIKYHIKTKWKENVIGLHNFENGYCGISKIEDDRYCLCYMVKSDKLKQCNGDIEQLETIILKQNPHLMKIWEEREVVMDFPISISQINFTKKAQVENHILMLGDAAGMITPLCGNGMSIALQTGKISARLINQFLINAISRSHMEANYSQQWRQHFAGRMKAGRALQRYFGSSRLSGAFVNLLNTLPFLADPVVKLTHGKPF